MWFNELYDYDILKFVKFMFNFKVWKLDGVIFIFLVFIGFFNLFFFGRSKRVLVGTG